MCSWGISPALHAHVAGHCVHEGSEVCAAAPLLVVLPLLENGEVRGKEARMAAFLVLGKAGGACKDACRQAECVQVLAGIAAAPCCSRWYTRTLTF